MRSYMLLKWGGHTSEVLHGAFVVAEGDDE